MKHAILILLLAASGCATTTYYPNHVEIATTGDVHRASVSVGLTCVDPSAYSGWSGQCPGAELDAQGFYLLASNAGISARLLMDSAATWPNVRAHILAAAAPLQPGDLLILTFSGHGGQFPDDNRDEPDGMDETICLWDHEVRDDDFLQMLYMLPPGLRIVLISDSCHAEGNFRSAVRKIQQLISRGRWGRIRPDFVLLPRTEWTGQLIQFAGCRESDYSYGSAEYGGTWSSAIIRSYHYGLCWKQWWQIAASSMPPSQEPLWIEFGPVHDTFRNAKALYPSTP